MNNRIDCSKENLNVFRVEALSDEIFPFGKDTDIALHPSAHLAIKQNSR